MAVDNKTIHALMAHFVKRYTHRYGHPPKDYNRYRDKHGFSALIEQYGSKDSFDLVDYYFDSSQSRGYGVKNFLYSYDELMTRKLEREQDDRMRAEIREATRQRVEEWRKLNGIN